MGQVVAQADGSVRSGFFRDPAAGSVPASGAIWRWNKQFTQMNDFRSEDGEKSARKIEEVMKIRLTIHAEVPKDADWTQSHLPDQNRT